MLILLEPVTHSLIVIPGMAFPQDSDGMTAAFGRKWKVVASKSKTWSIINQLSDSHGEEILVG